MPYHIIVKESEATVASKLKDVFSNFPLFIVEEVATIHGKGIHWHCWVDCDWKEDKVRREVDKIRESKKKGVSIRSWDYNLIYFCKGSKVLDAPLVQIKTIENLPCVVRCNTVDSMTVEKIWELHTEFWANARNPDINKDIKPVKLLDELIDEVRDKDVTPHEVCSILVDLVLSKNGNKMAPNKFLAQSYIRTALLFTANSKKYIGSLKTFYMNNLFV